MKFSGKLKTGEVIIPKTDCSPEIIIKDVDVEYAVEYSLDEVKGSYELVRTIIKDMPVLFEELKAGCLKFKEIDKEMTNN